MRSTAAVSTLATYLLLHFANAVPIVPCRQRHVLQTALTDDESPCEASERTGVVLSAAPSSSPPAAGSVQLTAYPRGLALIYNEGVWGTICGHYFRSNSNGANVVCRQLGYGGGTWFAAKTLSDPSKSEREALPIGIGGVRCAGTEDSLLACRLARDASRC
eukprot:6274574-Prymnesium_polylepis.1